MEVRSVPWWSAASNSSRTILGWKCEIERRSLIGPLDPGVNKWRAKDASPCRSPPYDGIRIEVRARQVLQWSTNPYS